MPPSTSSTPIASAQPTASIDQVRHLLRERRNPSKLDQSPWLTVSSVRAKQQVDPQLTPVAALLLLLDETLASLAVTQPRLADLLRGRFWEGWTVEAMVAHQRPESQSIRRFHQQQDQALHAFTQLLAQAEVAGHAHTTALHLQQRLPMPTYETLFGVTALAQQLCEYLHQPEHYPIVSIKGIGGIGKTALVDFTIRQHLQQACHWHDLLWVSAKQEYLTLSGIQQGTVARGTHIRLDPLFDEIGAKLRIMGIARLPLREKVERLAAVLRAQPHLIVLDNLESVEDFRQLVPWLMQMARPTQFVLTARITVPDLSTMTVVDLDELAQPAAYELIHHLAEKKNVNDYAPEAIYQLVGGNPLAIILIVSQMAFLPAERVLAGLRTGESADIYTYIYRQAWSMLDQNAQGLLFAIQRVGDEADYQWLIMSTDLPASTLDDALRRLYDLSLVQLQRSVEGAPTYGLHRLTSTFLRTEVLGWK